MKNKLIKLLFCLLSIFTFSQNISFIANYNIKLAEDNLSYIGKLQFNDSISAFQFQNYHENRWEKYDEFGMGQVIFTDSIGKYYTKNINKPIITAREFCKRIPKIYIDTLSFNWKYGTSEKYIGNYLCKDASIEFRGRTYTAWYSLELPFSFGPWKFSGLPGLILEVYDKNKDVNIKLNEIEVFKNESIKIVELTDRIVNQKDFLICKDEEWDEKVEKNKANILKLQSQFPDLEINDGGLSNKKRSDIATEIYEK